MNNVEAASELVVIADEFASSSERVRSAEKVNDYRGMAEEMMVMADRVMSVRDMDSEWFGFWGIDPNDEDSLKLVYRAAKMLLTKWIKSDLPLAGQTNEEPTQAEREQYGMQYISETMENFKSAVQRARQDTRPVEMRLRNISVEGRKDVVDVIFDLRRIITQQSKRQNGEKWNGLVRILTDTIKRVNDAIG